MKAFLLSLSLACLAVAQPRETAARTAGLPEQPRQSNAIFRVTVVARTAKAINYRHRSGSTRIDFEGTALLPRAHGEAKVESKKGYIEIEVEFRGMEPAIRFGREYLTYVMWAITPEGRATNLGEILLDADRGKLNVTTELQAFGLIVTAEPYFAVIQPSDVVVMENVVRPDTKGKIEEIDAKYELLARGQYTFDSTRKRPAPLDPNTPLELYEARNALEIAQALGADRYAAESYQKADRALQQAEAYHQRKGNFRKPVAMLAREAVQTAEDARAITVRRQEEERLASERKAAADREAAAIAVAEQEAKKRELAEERQRQEKQLRLKAEIERLGAERARFEAEVAAQKAAAARAEAEAARAQAEAAKAIALAQQKAAEAEAERSRLAFEEASRSRARPENGQQDLRTRLLQQFNLIAETRDALRGLVLRLDDSLFDGGKLVPVAREKLARLAGMVVALPGLLLEAEGYAEEAGNGDSTGKLGQQRAEAVRDYLIEQGVRREDIAARGFGDGEQNRRVELIISGEAIGTR